MYKQWKQFQQKPGITLQGVIFRNALLISEAQVSMEDLSICKSNSFKMY